MVHDSVDINALEGDVVQHWPHGQGGALQDVILSNFQQLAPVAQAPHTSLQCSAVSRTRHLRARLHFTLICWTQDLSLSVDFVLTVFETA